MCHIFVPTCVFLYNLVPRLVFPWEYALFNGGVAALAGLSCHLHGQEHGLFKYPTCEPFKLLTGNEEVEYNNAWRALSIEARSKEFRERALAPSAEDRHLHPLEDFHQYCRDHSDRPITVFLGSPLTALATTAREAPDVVSRVVYISAMSTAWDGGQVCAA